MKKSISILTIIGVCIGYLGIVSFLAIALWAMEIFKIDLFSSFVLAGTGTILFSVLVWLKLGKTDEDPTDLRDRYTSNTSE